MRKVLVAFAAILVAGLGSVTPATGPAAFAAVNPKVAIIVGATHDATDRYRSSADQVAAAARRYTTNVVKVYSPNATWSKVKSAVAGASVIVYLGHGNGWPSPYTYDPNYTTKNGFGLDYDVNGNGKLTDYEVKYYGEPSIRELNPAPNAVVLLFHLCYASGNSEPGRAEPSLTTAKQRVDNYAAAFLKAGARAVVANGHSHADYYIDALFNTRQSILDYWQSTDAHDNVSIYGSARNPGLQFAMDPERPGAYYRALDREVSLTTTDVTGAAYADTSRDPAAITVPGNASPVADGTPVYGSPATSPRPATPLPRLTPPRGSALTGSTRGRPRRQPHLRHPHRRRRRGRHGRLLAGPARRHGAAPVGGRGRHGHLLAQRRRVGRTGTASGCRCRSPLPGACGSSTSEAATAPKRPAPATARSSRGHLSTPPMARTAGCSRRATSGERSTRGGRQLHRGHAGTQTAHRGRAADGTRDHTDGDGVTDGISFAADASEGGSLMATVLAGDEVVADMSAAIGPSGATVRWNGKVDDAWAPDGDYRVRIRAIDAAGNRSSAVERDVTLYTALGHLRTSTAAFFPQDGDRLGSTATLGFTLASPAIVDWTIRDTSGAVVRTLQSAAALEAGSQSFGWNGRTDAGVMVPRGTYRSVVTAGDGTVSVTQSVSVTADAFRIGSSDSTPARGQRITITAVSAESLDAPPRLRVYQPGIAAWSVTMKRTDTRVYKATITLKSSKAGTVRFRVSAYDSTGAAQSSNLYLALH